MSTSPPEVTGRAPGPPKLHLDKRASAIAAQGVGAADQMLTTPELAHWLGVSPQFLELGRIKGYGPPFARLAPRNIRYRRGDVLRWLETRFHTATSEYSAGGSA
jgi:hypothetical protein